MTTPEDLWTARLHAAVDDHPRALTFEVSSYVAAGRRRTRRNRVAALATAAAAAAVVAAVATLAGGTRGGAPEPVGPVVPTWGPGTNGWVALDVSERDDGGGAIFLARPGEDVRRLEVPGPTTADDACPAWSPDGTRLLFGRLLGPPDAASRQAELVVAPVGRDGSPRRPP